MSGFRTPEIPREQMVLWEHRLEDALPSDPPGGELVTIQKAAQTLEVAPSTVHRWLSNGFIAGEQLTPGAPGWIRMTEQLRERFVEDA